MPFYLKDTDALSQLAGLPSVLIVPCRFCPAASLAVRETRPCLEPFRSLLRTQAYESFIEALVRRLEAGGARVGVFRSRLLHQFVACMWTSRRRRELARRATDFEAVVVLGCNAMVDAVREAVDSSGCRVIQGMGIEGLMNVLPSMRFPLTLSLEMHGMTPLTRGDPSPDGLVFREIPRGERGEEPVGSVRREALQ